MVVIILTGTIDVKDCKGCARRNIADRYNDYAFALYFYHKTIPDIPIVFVENSGHESIQNLNKCHPDAEFLQFDGNNDAKKIGKSGGEGEALNYAVRNSKTIASLDNPILLKITGRYIVPSIQEIIKHVEYNSVECVAYTRFGHKDTVETEIFAIKRSVWDIFKLERTRETGPKLSMEFEWSRVLRVVESKIFLKRPPIAGFSGTRGNRMNLSVPPWVVKSCPSKYNNQ